MLCFCPWLEIYLFSDEELIYEEKRREEKKKQRGKQERTRSYIRKLDDVI
jgi:hypothetical protein